MEMWLNGYITHMILIMNMKDLFLHNDTSESIFSSSTTVGFTYVSLMFSKKYIYGIAMFFS